MPFIIGRGLNEVQILKKEIKLVLNRMEYFDNKIDTDKIAKCHLLFVIGGGFAEVHFLEKKKLIITQNFAYTLKLTRSSPKDFQLLAFIVGCGFEEEVTLDLTLLPYEIFW